MNNAEHIFAWAMNDSDLYRKMRTMAAISSVGDAAAIGNLVHATCRAMRIAGDAPHDMVTRDIVQAGLLFHDYMTAVRIAPDVASATHRNDHTGARMIIARAYGFEAQLVELAAISNRTASRGYMSPTDIALRTDHTNDMFAMLATSDARDVLSEAL